MALDESSVCVLKEGAESEVKGQSSHRVPCPGTEMKEELSLQAPGVSPPGVLPPA